MAVYTGSTALPTFTALQIVTASQLQTLSDALHGLADAETAYTPAIKYGTTSWTLGNATVDFTYRQVGKFVMGSGRIIMGSSTTFGGSVTGALSISLPTTARRTGQDIPIGDANIVDVSASTGYQCQIYLNSTAQQMVFQVGGPSGSYGVQMAASAGVGSPFTFANTDQIKVEFDYEAA